MAKVIVQEMYRDGRVNRTAEYDQLDGEHWFETLQRVRYPDHHVVFDTVHREADVLTVTVYPAKHTISVAVHSDTFLAGR
jgi:hypothetical protein